MDLGAYANIDDLSIIAKRNNIIVPRLRGYRLMKDEAPVDIDKVVDKREVAISCVRDLCTSRPFWNPNSNCAEFSYITDIKKEYFLVKGSEDGFEDYIDVRWDRIHGWKRKVLKTYIHNEIKRQRKQWETWNKYVGRDDILYIHARIGGGNWEYYYKEVAYQPWFLEKVDDSFDSTYCDIYAKINSEVDNNV